MTRRNTRPRMPLSLKAALGVLAFQVLANAVLGIFMVYVSFEDAEHGRDVPLLQHLLGYGSVVIAVVLLVCGVLLARRVPAARPVVVFLEVLAVCSGIASVVQGAPNGMVGIVLSLLVIMHLFRADVTAWLRGLPEDTEATPATR